MSHYEIRMQRDLDEIRRRTAALAERVEASVRQAVRGLLRRDRALAAATVLADHPINRETREIDRLCHAFVARHLPSAGVLRTISAVLRLTVAFERVGDYAVTIARETAQLTCDAPPAIARDVELVAERSLTLLREAACAFNEQSADRARATKAGAGETKHASHRVFRDLVEVGQAGTAPPIADLFAWLMCINRLERIGDQAKNVCEETLFAVTGEVKQPKVYDIQFVDRTNAVASVMAEAIARRTFPESGRYSSAGWQPAEQVVPSVRAFLERHGHDLRGVQPRLFDASFDALEEHHVVVALEEGLLPHVPNLPFHTTIVPWSVLPEGDRGAELPGEEWLATLYRELSARIADLMETLRGPRAG